LAQRGTPLGVFRRATGPARDQLVRLGIIEFIGTIKWSVVQEIRSGKGQVVEDGNAEF